MSKVPQTERAMRRRAAKARFRATTDATLCPRHAARIRYGSAGGWHRFRCGCEAEVAELTGGAA